MITLVLGVPGSGKSYQARRWAERSVSKGYTVLWLSPLNSEKQRLYSYFITRLEPDQVKILPTKPEKCPIMNQLAHNMPQAYPLLSTALCRICKLRDSCPYYKEIRSIMEDIKTGKPRLYIGGFNYVWLAAIINRTVIDEFDQLYPQMYQAIPREIVEGILKLLESADKKAAEELKKRIAPSPFGDGYLFKPPSIVDMFLDRGHLHLLTATYSHDPLKPDPRLILGLENYEEVNINLVPHPPRKDKFILSSQKIYAKSRTKYTAYKYLAKLIKEDRESTVTIIARSKQEARTIHFFLERENLQALTESLNWSHKNQWDWKRNRIRIIVIGGIFHRSLDIDSDKIYAFYQYPPPEYPIWFNKTYPDAASIDPEASIIPVMRSHVQTLFRATRSWTKNHEVYLLDQSWAKPLSYYPHVWSFVENKLELVEKII